MKPVYIYNGFLGSGKTEFINFTLDQPYFQSSGKTLLLLCEEGEEEYDPYVLKRSKTIVETIEEEAVLLRKRWSSWKRSIIRSALS